MITDREWALGKAQARLRAAAQATARGDTAQALHEAHMGRGWIQLARRARG